MHPYVRLFALIVLSFVLHSPAGASEFKVCNKGTVPVKALYLSEVYAAFGFEWDINGWESIGPGECASLWRGPASASYVVVHVVFALVNDQGDVGIVKYDFDSGSEAQLTAAMRRKKRDAICGKYGLMQDRGGTLRSTERSLDTYKGACSAPYEALPVSVGGVLSGSNVFMTANVEPNARDYGRIVKVISKAEPGGALTRARILEGIKMALASDMKSQPRRFYSEDPGVWAGQQGDGMGSVGALLDESVRLFGEQHVLATSAKVLDTSGRVPAPPELGNWEDSLRGQALMNHWASGSPKAFILGQLRYSADYESFAFWSRAEGRYRELVARVGEDAVLKAAARLRDAPKKSFRGSQGVNRSLLADPAAFGCVLNEPGDCIERMFQDQGLTQRPARDPREMKRKQ